MARRVPDGPPPPPVVQRVRIRYAKRGRLRFSSHRDFARAFERALRRAEVPMGYSAGFSPHPKISYVGAAPTGVASEAEYVEIGLAREVDVEALRARLDAALPHGLDILEAVPAGPGSLPERIQASVWRIELPGVGAADAADALAAFLAQSEVYIERVTKDGHRTIDARSAVLSASVSDGADGPHPAARAILDLVVRQGTPAVRPDDVLAALRAVAGLALESPPVAVRLAQGPLDGSGAVGDPLAADRITAETAST
jgi:radical SAM-linked protein